MTVAISGNSAETRLLPLRRRADLECHELQMGGRRYWHVKDPLSLRYFQLTPEEHFVLMSLDGNVSLRDIQYRFEEAFAPLRLPTSQVQSFLVLLHGAGLIITDSVQQAEFLLKRQRDEQRRRTISALASVMAIRFRGVDPHGFLNWLTPRAGWWFGRVGGPFGLAIIVAGLLFALLKSDALMTRLPRFHEFFAGPNLLWLFATLGLTKVLHELGHAVSCRHFGAECPEMGFMLLVGTPCLYCNVSDAWMLPSRWHRIVISAAGVYVELILASLCLGLWWCSQPGLFNSLCLNVVVVCSFTTVLFNGNPLLRYDGYFIFADLVGIPNLRQQAGTLVSNLLGQWFFDTEVTSNRLMPQEHRGLLLAWFVGSAIYRVIVLWGILWFVNAVLEPYGLKPVALALAVMSVLGVILPPTLQVVALIRNPFWSRTVNWTRFWFRSALTAALVAIAMMVPLPFSVTAPAITQAEHTRHVFVQHPGQLLSTVAAGTQVTAGQTLAQLKNNAVNLQIERLSGEVKVLEQQLETLNSRRVREGQSVDQLIPTAQERLAKKRDELAQRETDRERLRILAPIAGRVLPPRARVKSADAKPSKDAVRAWTGTPLDEFNIGSTLDTGTELCEVAPTDRFEALLAIDENDVEFVSVGQKVELLIDHAGGRYLTGVVAEIAEIDLTIAPRELVEHPDFPTRLNSDGTARPVSTAYQARVRLDTDESLVVRGPGRARIEAAPQTLAARLMRFARRTFRIG